MIGLYGWLKVLHVLAAVLWVGAAATVSLMVFPLGRAGVRATFAAILPTASGFLRRVVGPASGLVLLSGVAMGIVGHTGMPLWVIWGLAGVLLHFIFGATVVRRSWEQLARLATASPPDEVAFVAAARRASIAYRYYVLMLVSVIIVMVLKPTL
jgi:hypothetical protein